MSRVIEQELEKSGVNFANKSERAFSRDFVSFHCRIS